MMCGMVVVLKSMSIRMFIKENTNMGKHMGKEFINGLKEVKLTMESGGEECDTGLEYGRNLMEIII